MGRFSWFVLYEFSCETALLPLLNLNRRSSSQKFSGRRMFSKDRSCEPILKACTRSISHLISLMLSHGAKLLCESNTILSSCVTINGGDADFCEVAILNMFAFLFYCRIIFY